MNINGWVLAWQRSWAREEIDVVLYQARPDGSRAVLNSTGECTLVPNGEAIKDPSFRFNPDQIQAFADGLWEMGIKPKGKRYEAEADLLKDHLADFKRLVFEKRIK